MRSVDWSCWLFQIATHSLESLASVELCSRHVPPLIWGNSTADGVDMQDAKSEVCSDFVCSWWVPDNDQISSNRNVIRSAFGCLTIPSAAASPAWSMRILPPCQSASCFNSMKSRNIGSAVLVSFVVRRLSGFIWRGSIQQDADLTMTWFSTYCELRWWWLSRLIFNLPCSGRLLSLRLHSVRRFWLTSPDPELAPFSNFRSSNNSGFSGIWKHVIPDLTWQYTTCRSEFKTTVHPSGSVTSQTMASELVWMPSSSIPLSPSSLSALATPSSGNCFDWTICFGLDTLILYCSLWCSSQFQCAWNVSDSPSSARKMTPAHVPWPALRLNKRFGVACPSFTAFACAHHEWCHYDRQMERRHAYPLGPFHNAWPKILVIVNVVLELCNTATPCFLQIRLAKQNFHTNWNGRRRTQSPIEHRRSWFHVHGRNFDVRSLGEPTQKSRSKPCSRTNNFSSRLPIYSCCNLVTMALRFGHKSSGNSSSRAVSPMLVFTVSKASKP